MPPENVVALATVIASELSVVVKVIYALLASSIIRADAWSSGILMLFSPALVNCNAPSAPPDRTRSPAISAELERSRVAASNSPVRVTFLNDPMSLLESTTTAKLAVTDPAETASRTFTSAAVVVTAVPPIINLFWAISINVFPAVSSLSSD